MTTIPDHSAFWMVDDTVGTPEREDAILRSYSAVMSRDDAADLARLAEQMQDSDADTVLSLFNAGVPANSEWGRALMGRGGEPITGEVKAGVGGTANIGVVEDGTDDIYDWGPLNAIKTGTRWATMAATFFGEYGAGALDTFGGTLSGESDADPNAILAGMSPVGLAAALALDKFDGDDDMSGWNDVLEGTGLWQSIGNWESQGDGWFGPGGEAGEALEKAKTEIWWNEEPDGEGGTVKVPHNWAGEAMEAQPFLDEGTWGYTVADFVSQFTYAVVTDPLTYATFGVSGAMKLGKPTMAKEVAKAKGLKQAEGELGDLQDLAAADDKWLESTREWIKANDEVTKAMEEEAKGLTGDALVKKQADIASARQASADALQNVEQVQNWRFLNDGEEWFEELFQAEQARMLEAGTARAIEGGLSHDEQVNMVKDFFERMNTARIGQRRVAQITAGQHHMRLSPAERLQRAKDDLIEYRDDLDDMDEFLDPAQGEKFGGDLNAYKAAERAAIDEDMAKLDSLTPEEWIDQRIDFSSEFDDWTQFSREWDMGSVERMLGGMDSGAPYAQVLREKLTELTEDVVKIRQKRANKPLKDKSRFTTDAEGRTVVTGAKGTDVVPPNMYWGIQEAWNTMRKVAPDGTIKDFYDIFSDAIVKMKGDIAEFGQKGSKEIVARNAGNVSTSKEVVLAKRSAVAVYRAQKEQKAATRTREVFDKARKALVLFNRARAKADPNAPKLEGWKVDTSTTGYHATPGQGQLPWWKGNDSFQPWFADFKQGQIEGLVAKATAGAPDEAAEAMRKLESLADEMINRAIAAGDDLPALPPGKSAEAVAAGVEPTAIDGVRDTALQIEAASKGRVERLAEEAKTAFDKMNTNLHERKTRIAQLRESGVLDDVLNAVEGGDRALLEGRIQELLGITERGVDYETFTRALGGRFGNTLLKVLARETNPRKINDIGKRRLSDETVHKLAEADNVEDVTRILHEAAGAWDTSKGVMRPIKNLGAKTQIAKEMMGPAEKNFLKQIGHAAADGVFWTYRQNQKIVPWAKPFVLHDGQVAANVWSDWVDLTLDTVRGTRKLGVREKERLKDEMVNPIFAARSAEERRVVIQQGLQRMMHAVGDAEGLKDMDSPFYQKMQEAFDEVLKRGQEGTSSNYFPTSTVLAGSGKEDIINGVNMANNQVIKHLDQASDFAQLPNVKHIQRLVAMGKKAEKDPKLRRKLGDLIETKLDRLFRIGVLVFRPAYVLRNLGEASFRMWLHGSLHDPLTMLAMSMNKEKGWLARHNAYRTGVKGDDLGRASADEVNAQIYMGEQIDVMSAVINRTHSTLDPGFAKTAREAGGQILQPGMKGYSKAWASSVRRLQADPVTSMVVGVARGGKHVPKEILDLAAKMGLSNEDALAYYFAKGAGRDYFVRMASERPEFWGRALSSKTYDDVLKKHPNDAAKQQHDLAVAIGREIESGAYDMSVANMKRALMDSDTSFLNEAKATFAKGDWNLWDSVSGMKPEARVEYLSKYARKNKTQVPENQWGSAQGYYEAANQVKFVEPAVNWFFNKAAMAEGAWNWTPNTLHAYWKSAEEMFPYLSRAEQKTMLANARKSLKPLKVGMNKQTRMFNRLQKQYDNPTKTKYGTLTLEEVDDVARKAAADDSKELFYDAMARKQYWYASRLAFPFGQAWGNTLAKWAELAATAGGFVRVVSAAKAYNAATGGYEHFDRKIESEEDWKKYKRRILQDPASRPLIYQDPQSGAMVTDVNITGSIITGLGSLAAGQGFQTNMASAATPISSINLATGGGSILPGLGPAITVPYKTLTNMTDWEEHTPKFIQEWVDPFPSGVDKSALQGAAEGFMPTWFKRVAAWADPKWGDQEIQAMQPALANYLLSNHPDKYEVNEAGVIGNPELLASDTFNLARWTSLSRGLFQAGLPSSVMFKWKIDSEDHETSVTQIAASQDFQKMIEDNNGDFSKALEQFDDTYGPGAFLTIVGKSNTEGVSPTTNAAAYFKDNDRDLDKYGEVAGLFFPYNGTYSPVFDRELRKRGMKTRRTIPEMIEEANKMRYTQRSAWLNEDVERGRLTREGAAKLRKEFAEDLGLHYRPVEGPGWSEKDIMIRKALSDSKSKLKDTDAGKAAAEYLLLREEATRRAGGSLSGDENEPFRQYLLEQGQALVEDYPTFEPMWTKHFSKDSDLG